jgi:hypothetical protein
MRSPLASIRDPNGALYFHVRVVNPYGQEEDWFLTDTPEEESADSDAVDPSSVTTSDPAPSTG